MPAVAKGTLVALLAVALSGCGAGPDVTGQTGRVAGWILGDEPALQIGVVEGPPEYAFTSIVAAWRWDDGTVVVAESRHRELRLYDSAGRFVRAAGGPGEGPGEFTALSFAGPYRGDSILVWDSGARRVSVFTGEGQLGRTRTLFFESEPQGVEIRGFSSPLFHGTLADGDMVVTPPAFVLASETAPDPSRAIRWYSAEAEPLGEIGSLPAMPSPAAAFTPQMLLLGPGAVPSPPFRQSAALAVGEDRVFFGPGTDYEIHVVGTDGSELAVIRSSHRDLAVDEDARQSYLNQQRQVFADRPQEALEEVLSQMPFPEFLPPYSRLLSDADGHLWVEDYPLPGQPRSWSVFDREGRRIAEVEVPAHFEVYDIGQDYLLGVETDDLDIPHVKLYSLSRTPD